MNIRDLARGRTARTLLVGTGVLTAVALTGCGVDQATSGSPAPANNQTVATAPNSASSGAATPNAQSAPAVQAQAAGSTRTPTTTRTVHGLPECNANTLSLSFGGSDAGMSQQEQVLRFTNTGKRTCAIVGFPGVSYVAGDNGAQVGPAAVRTGSIGAQVDLAPGQVASTVVHSVDPGVFDASACKPTAVRGFRVYAPDDRAAMFIPLPAGAQGCAGATPDAQLSVVTITRGLGQA